MPKDVVIRVKVEVSDNVAEALERVNKVNMKKLFFTSVLNMFDSANSKESYNKMLNFAMTSSNLLDNSGGITPPQAPVQMPVSSQNTTNVETSSNLDTQHNKKADEKVKDNKAVEKIESNLMDFEKIEKKEEA